MGLLDDLKSEFQPVNERTGKDPTFKIGSPENLGNAALAVGVAAAADKLGFFKKKKKKSNVPLPKSKPKFSNVQVPVGKPKQTRKPQTLKDEKGKAIIKKYTGGPKGYVPAYEMGRPSKVKK
tara:strand:- start:43 stop:408 length:366 start_codon:yes stop_codon:yes gene_type:complete